MPTDEQLERYRKNPIFGTDFSRPLPTIVETLRSQIAQIRGNLSDIRYAYPGWGERVESIEGLLTCGLIALAHVVREMELAARSKEESSHAD